MATIPGNVSTVISGSYRRSLAGMYSLKRSFEKRGITVLSPIGASSVNPGDEFLILDEDPLEDHRILQDSVFAKIRRSTFLTSFNEGGYLGKASLLEYGYAISLGIQILTLEPADDPNVLPYTRLLSDVFPGLEF